MISYAVLRLEELSPQQWLEWEALLRADAVFQSPYFRPEFMSAMRTIGHRVEVMLMQEAGKVVGLLPFERTFWNVGRPVGGTLSDFHGVITSPQRQIDWPALLKACRLRGWEYSAYVPQASSPQALRSWPSMYIDTSAGYAAYAQQRKQAGSETIGKTVRKMRRLQNELGLRFELRNSNARLIDKLLQWKKQHYAKQGISICLESSRIGELWKNLAQQSSQNLAGCLSVLWAGDEPAGLSYSICSHKTAHVWFIGYNQSFARYSPGLILLLQIAEHFALEGVERIHLGRGQERFKSSLASGQIDVAEGTIGGTSFSNTWLKTWHSTKLLVKNSPIDSAVRWLRGKFSAQPSLPYVNDVL